MTPRRPTAPRPRTIDEVLADARSRLHRLTPAEADAARANGAFLVDIRPAAQRAAEGELPSATPIERNVLEWRLDPASDASLPIASHDLEVVVLCQEGYTSSLAAAALQELGIHRATDVIGGYAAWRAWQASAEQARAAPPSRRRRGRSVAAPRALRSVARAGHHLGSLRLVRPALGRERRAGLLDVAGQGVDVLAAHRLLDQGAHDRHVLGVGRQRVGRDHPATLGRQLPGDVELVVVLLAGQPEGDERKLLLVPADQLEAARLPRAGRRACRAFSCMLRMM